MKRLLLVAVMLLACRESAAPSQNAQIAGGWTITGRAVYSTRTCYDTLAAVFTQSASDQVRGQATWRFVCGSEPVYVGPTLVVIGYTYLDSVRFTWLTDSTWGPCGSCGVFVMSGRVDSVGLSGVYSDHLGGHGTWRAQADGTTVRTR